MTYFGFKLHATASFEGVFKTVDLAPANVHDIHYMSDIKYQLTGCQIIGDKGYLSEPLKIELAEMYGIKLLTPMRANQKDFQRFPVSLAKIRKRIETRFSQLDGQFNFARNLAKTFAGLRARTVSKIAAMTFVQFLNKFELNRDIGQIMVPIC